MNLAMWRYQSLYEAMNKNTLFKVYIVLSPCISFSKEQQFKDIEKIREYFSKNSIPYIDYDFNDAFIAEISRLQNCILVTDDGDYANYLQNLDIVTNNRILLMFKKTK